MGAGPRLSVLGAMPRISGDAPPGARRRCLGAAGKTQIGEPLFAGAPAPAGRTMIDQPAAPPGSRQPTARRRLAAGRRFPTPPPMRVKKSGSGPIIAGAAVLGVIGLVVVVVLVKKGEATTAGRR